MYISRTTAVSLILMAAGCIGGWFLADHPGSSGAFGTADLSPIADTIAVAGTGLEVPNSAIATPSAPRTPGGGAPPVQAASVPPAVAPPTASDDAAGAPSERIEAPSSAAPTPSQVPTQAEVAAPSVPATPSPPAAPRSPGRTTEATAPAPPPGAVASDAPRSASLTSGDLLGDLSPLLSFGSAPAAASVPAPTSVLPATANAMQSASAAAPTALQWLSPPFFAEQLFTPLRGAASRAVAFSEWESYRTDVAGRNILVTTDDSNFFRDRIGKLNANTGDTDASGLNIMSAYDSVVLGTESADEAPYQTWAAALVDILTGRERDPDDKGDEDEDEDEDEDSESDEDEADEDKDKPDQDDDEDDVARAASALLSSLAPAPAQVASASVTAPGVGAAAPLARAVVMPAAAAASEEFDFPYMDWLRAIDPRVGSAIHTDEGTTMAAGVDALVIGGDGYDDDDNRAVGENIVITRDDGNVVLGGTGMVNAQIGDSEQGAVIMDIIGTYIKGGGAY